MPTKIVSSQRDYAVRAPASDARHHHSTREQLPLRDLADCLLAAYDGVSKRAFQRLVERGSSQGSETADWRAAENELFSRIDVEFEESGGTLYALAAVSGLSAPQLAVAIEDRWLLISGHLARSQNLEPSRSSRECATRRMETTWIEWEELQSILVETCALDEMPAEQSSSRNNEPGNAVEARPFCVVELPVGVDVARSEAILSDGMIAIRMPISRESSTDKSEFPADL
jgi:HSP20 family molecular chaperone IbpA